MENEKIITDDNLNAVDYCTTVELIADGYFDDNGAYSPHFGILNAIALFYNICVKKSEVDKELDYNINDLTNVDILITNENFMQAFKDAINNNGSFTFGNAYSVAMDIVANRKHPLNTLMRFIGDAALNITRDLDSIMTGDSSVASFFADALKNDEDETIKESAAENSE